MVLVQAKEKKREKSIVLYRVQNLGSVISALAMAAMAYTQVKITPYKGYFGFVAQQERESEKEREKERNFLLQKEKGVVREKLDSDAERLNSGGKEKVGERHSMKWEKDF